MVDEPLRKSGEALRAEAMELSAAGAQVLVLSPQGGRLTPLPRGLTSDVAAADLMLSLFSTLDLSEEAPVIRAAKAAFTAAGKGRWGIGASIDDGVLQQGLGGDYRQVERITSRLQKRLSDVRQVRLRTKAGTDLTFAIHGRPVWAETGIWRYPGQIGNLPAGEVYVAPLEQSAEGTLVVDLCAGDLTLTDPLQITFRGGRAVHISGGGAAELIGRLGHDPWAWTVGEFGLGTNPFTPLRGKASTDEKVLGTAHVALGGNLSFGGYNPATTHYDCVISGARVEFDGMVIIVD